MKKSHVLLLVFMLILSVCNPYIAKADVYIDLSEASEISISNTLENRQYTFKIEEPISPLEISRKNASYKPQQLNSLPFNSEVVIAANESSLEPALIHAVIAAESNHNPKAQSKKGAYGLMQLMPETSKRFKVSIIVKRTTYCCLKNATLNC